jgi:hypothetical protein
MSAWIRPAAALEILDVARRMRAADRLELEAGLWDASPEAIAHGMSAPGRIALACGRARAEAVVGIAWRAPRLVEVAMIATDAFPRIALPLTRHVRRALMPALLARGVIRAECRSIEGHVAAHRWLLALGAAPEAMLDDCGKGRERFVLFAWTLARLEAAGRDDRGDRACA